MENLQCLIYLIKETPVQFSTEGSNDEPPVPGLCIKDIGEISLPLCDLQAQNVIQKLKENSIKNNQEIK